MDGGKKNFAHDYRFWNLLEVRPVQKNHWICAQSTNTYSKNADYLIPITRGGFLKQINVRLGSVDVEGQRDVQMILNKLSHEFPQIRAKIKVQEKKFTPQEVALMIIIGFAGEISADLVMTILRKLWFYLTKEKVLPDVEELDRVKLRAENYIQGLGISQAEITTMKDEGPYVKFRFMDPRNTIHTLVVAKTDLSVLKYIRKEGK